MNKANNCPFCGSEAKEYPGIPELVGCSGEALCPASSGWFPLEIWNTRATPPGMIKTEDSHQRVIDAVTGARRSWLKQGMLLDGYKVVPVEPTEAMLKAALDLHLCDTDGAKSIYKAMIEAATIE